MRRERIRWNRADSAGAANIARDRGALYVADPEGASRAGLRPRRRSRCCGFTAASTIRPTCGRRRRRVFVLDRARPRTTAVTRRRRRARLVVPRADRPAAGTGSRSIARDGSTCATRVSIRRAATCSRRHRRIGTAKPLRAESRHGAESRDRFDPAAVRSDERGRLVAADRLLDPCGLRRPPDRRRTRAWWLGDRDT